MDEDDELENNERNANGKVVNLISNSAIFLTYKMIINHFDESKRKCILSYCCPC